MAVCLSAALAFAGCGKTPPRRETPAARPVAVRVARVVAGGPQETTAPGVVASRESAEILARASASVRSVLVREGDDVRPGQLLLVLDDRSAQARLEAAEAARRSAASDRERVAALLGRGAATTREREEADSAAQAAESVVAEARSALAYLRIAAPFAGRVAAAPARAGDLVVPGQPLLTLESKAGYELRATVEAATAVRLRPGDRVAVAVDGIPDRLEGRVAALSPAADPRTHRFLLRADLPGDDRLRSGLFGRVVLASPGTGAPRRIVPREAIVERGGLTGVFVLEEGRARLRWVALGAGDGEAVDVRAGLRLGETVVLAPGSLEDGAPVEEKR
jgi:RND family efflux transporter MFP subunit